VTQIYIKFTLALQSNTRCTITESERGEYNMM